MLQQELDLLQFTTVDVAQFRAGLTKIMRSEMIKLATGGAVANDIPTTFSKIPFTNEVSCRLTVLKTLPSAAPAAVSHPSTTALTQIGIETVRT